MKAMEIYEKLTGKICPTNQIAYHEWQIEYHTWLEENAEQLYNHLNSKTITLNLNDEADFAYIDFVVMAITNSVAKYHKEHPEHEGIELLYYTPEHMEVILQKLLSLGYNAKAKGKNSIVLICKDLPETTK